MKASALGLVLVELESGKDCLSVLFLTVTLEVPAGCTASDCDLPGMVNWVVFLPPPREILK